MGKIMLRSTVRKLKAISDPTRIKLLYMLTQKQLCVCELTFALGLAQPTVSRHLKQLEESGFVGSRREGSWTIYFIEPEDEINGRLLELVLDRIKEDRDCRALRKKLKNIDRCAISGQGKYLKDNAASSRTIQTGG